MMQRSLDFGWVWWLYSISPEADITTSTKNIDKLKEFLSPSTKMAGYFVEIWPDYRYFGAFELSTMEDHKHGKQAKSNFLKSCKKNCIGTGLE